MAAVFVTVMVRVCELPITAKPVAEAVLPNDCQLLRVDPEGSRVPSTVESSDIEKVTALSTVRCDLPQAFT